MITAATMMDMPRMMEPMMIPSDVFWSSSISFLMENGVKSLLEGNRDP